MNRGRGKFGAGPSARGGGGGHHGGNQSGPLFSTHLNDLDMELQLLQRKRQIFEQEQNLMDRFSNITSSYSFNNTSSYPSNNTNNYLDNTNHYSNNSNKRQYENVQQGSSNQYYQHDYSSSYQPAPAKVRPSPTNFRPANVRPQGIKRQSNTPVWDNQNPNPPKRFNAPQRPSPWQHQDTTPEYRSVNQAPPQPKNFSAQTRAFTNHKPGIGQRIKNKYNPPAERKNFNPTKVTKPNFKSAPKTGYRSMEETKKLVEETNKLIAHTNKMVSQSPSAKRKFPPKSQTPASEIDNVLHPDKPPTGPVKGRLELALGMIVKAVKDLCPDAETQEYFLIPFIQRVIKQTIRDRIRDVMLNQPVVSVTKIVDRYRKEYPEETDLQLLKIAQDAISYNKKHGQVLQLIDTADPEGFFKRNISKVMHRKLEDMFADLQKMYENKTFNIEECALSLVDESNAFKDNKVKAADEGLEKFSDVKKANGDKDPCVSANASVEKEASGDKEISGEKAASDVKRANEEKEKSGEINASEEVVASEEIAVSEEKDASGEKVFCTIGGLPRPRRKNVMDQVHSTDVTSIEDQLDARTARAQKYVEFMEKLLEEKLPILLPHFKETIMSVMCADKEFVYVKAMLVMEAREKVRQSAEKNTIVLDGSNKEDGVQATAPRAKTATPNKPASTAKPALAITVGKAAAQPTAAATPVAQPTAVASPAASPTSAAKPDTSPTTAAKPAAQPTAAKTEASPTTAAKPATQPTAGRPLASPSSTAKPEASPTTVAKTGAQPTAARPAASPTSTTKAAATATTAVKPAAQPSTPAKAAEPESPVKPATPASTAAKLASSTVTAANTATPDNTSAKPATPAITPVKPASAANEANSVPSTPKTPVSKDIQYVKLLGNPALPARAVIYDFLKQFNPASIKKHKTIHNLLVIGFADKQGVEKILAASESVVGESTIIVKASEQIATPQNKNAQQGNKTPIQTPTEKITKTQAVKTSGQENKASESKTIEKVNKTPEKDTNNKESNAEENDTSTDDIISSDLDCQITDLLSSIRKADEEEKVKANEPQNKTEDDKMVIDLDNEINKLKKSDEKIEKTAEEIKMDTDLDNEIAEFTKNGEKSDEKMEKTHKEKNDRKSDEKTEETTAEKVGTKGEAGDKIKTKDLDTIMEVDDEKKPEGKKAKAVEEVSKTAKETGRATPTRSSSRLANVTPSTIKTRRASRLANNN